MYSLFSRKKFPVNFPGIYGGKWKNYSSNRRYRRARIDSQPIWLRNQVKVILLNLKLKKLTCIKYIFENIIGRNNDNKVFLFRNGIHYLHVCFFGVFNVRIKRLGVKICCLDRIFVRSSKWICNWYWRITRWCNEILWYRNYLFRFWNFFERIPKRNEILEFVVMRPLQFKNLKTNTEKQSTEESMENSLTNNGLILC